MMRSCSARRWRDAHARSRFRPGSERALSQNQTTARGGERERLDVVERRRGTVRRVSRITIEELLAESRHGLIRLSPGHAAAALRNGATLIDIRSDSQVARDGVVPGAVVVARNVLEWRLDPSSDHRLAGAPGLDDHVILMCDQGYQSSLAAATLHRLGFARATDVEGGFQAWRAAGLPVQTS